MDSVLQGLPHVICYIDDILVTGTSDGDHLKNLATVLERLQKHGFRMKREKCEFLQPAVEYLGHKVDAKGLPTTDKKVKAITRTLEPKNVQELCSFLGLLHYYGKFLPNLTTPLQPLNESIHLRMGQLKGLCEPSNKL